MTTSATLNLAGIVSAPPTVWVTVGNKAEVKFQCVGSVNTAHDQVTFLEGGWTGKLNEYKNSNKITLVTDPADAEEQKKLPALHTVTVTLSGLDAAIDGLSVTCYVQNKETSLKLDWITTTFKTICMLTTLFCFIVCSPVGS